MSIATVFRLPCNDRAGLNGKKAASSSKDPHLTYSSSVSNPPVLGFSELNARPHETFAEYRSVVPFLNREDGAHLLLRGHDVQRFVKDPKTRQVETELLRARGIKAGPLVDLVANSMLFSNGEVHRRRRQAMAKCFSFSLMQRIRPEVRRLAQGIINSDAHAEGFKLRDDFAAVIPAVTLAAILGISQSDVPLFTSLAYRVSKILTTSWVATDLPAMEEATRQLVSYCEDLMAERRRKPQDDFLSQYVASVDGNADLSPTEAVMQLVSVVLGGTDTTRAAIVIQTGLLLERPDIWNAIKADDRLIAPAVAESLRLEPAVASIPRLVVEEIDIEGHLIPRGSVLLLSTMSALRDPLQFPQPNEFDLHRERPRWHPVYGDGEHRCLGQALAQIELEEALRAVMESRRELRMEDQTLRVSGHAGIRQVEDMFVQFS